MRAISLWEPWASAISFKSKRVETRSWSTAYRGPLAIHAAKRCVRDELAEFQDDDAWVAALWPLAVRNHLVERLPDLRKHLPFGCVVAVCQLVACRPTQNFPMGELCSPRVPPPIAAANFPRPSHRYSWDEYAMGDFSPGRWGWVLDEIQILPRPLPWVGKQGFFEVDSNAIADRLLEVA